MVRSQLWFSEQVPPKDGQKQPVYAISISPDKTKFLAAIGSRVHLYNTEDGSLISVLKHHTKHVYTVSWARDSLNFASSGADKTVILYNQDNQPSLRYSHDSSVQVLTHSPTDDILVSCCNTEFGIHASDHRVVKKTSIPSKTLSASFSADGQFFAIGMFNGVVSIREPKDGKERCAITLTSPISSLCFSPNMDAVQDRLIIGTADRKLHSYGISGTAIIKTPKSLQFDPLGMKFSRDGKSLFLTGSNKKVSLWTRDLVYIDDIAEIEDWGWSVEVLGSQQNLNNINYFVGSNDGTLYSFICQIPTVHSLFNDIYVHREHLTSVSTVFLNNLNNSFVINSKDFIKKVAAGPGRVLVQTLRCIHVYELSTVDNAPTANILNIIHKNIDCSLLTVTTNHFISCKANVLSCYQFDGSFVRSWSLPGHVRYVRLLPGPIGKESLLIGCKTGQISRIFVNSSVIVTVVDHHVATRCLDLNPSRDRLAVVDDQRKLTVYDLSQGSAKVVVSYSNATSVAYNTKYRDMFAYSTATGDVEVVTLGQSSQSYKSFGFVVGFIGSKLFF
ncbi:hypothetical protein GEMRC1_010049 [Eukaryota sp. GEM-RC1]